ncbi:MAG: GIY-YIG nuclease family protein [Bacteroidota bacterium]
MKTRKELKEEYKQIKYKMGVFQIRNKTNGKIYISSSADLDAIWHAERLQLNMGIHQNAALQKDWKMLGSDHFEYEIIDIYKPKDNPSTDYTKDIKTLEKMFIEELQPFGNKGYNK